MKKFISFVFTLSLFFTHPSFADTKTANTTGQFKQVELASFIQRNYVSKQMADKKQRAMLPPSAVQFNAKLMQAPTPGEFSLVYDALLLWPSDAPLPKIDHSAFLQAKDGRVISVYVSDAAAAQLKALYQSSPVDTHIYAIHIYNYAQGPRLVVIGASAAS